MKAVSSDSIFCCFTAIDLKKLLAFSSLDGYAACLRDLSSVFPRSSYCRQFVDVGLNISAASHELMGLLGNTVYWKQWSENLLPGCHLWTYPKLGIAQWSGHSAQVRDPETTSSIVKVKTYPSFLERHSRTRYGESIFSEALDLVRLCCLSSATSDFVELRNGFEAKEVP